MFLLKIIAAIAYVSLGLPDSMLGVAWPSIRNELNKPLDAVGLLLAATFVGYLISSSSAPWVARKLGMNWLLISSSLTMTLVLLGFFATSSFELLICLGLLGGLGGGAIDSSLNNFSAHHFSIRMVNWLHGCWGIGSFLGPLIMTALLVSQLSWRWAYLIIGILLGLTTVLLWLTRQQWHESPEDTAVQPHANAWSAICDGQVLSQCILFYLYTGIESTVGQLLFTYWTEGKGLAEGLAGLAISAYWFLFTINRFAMGQLSTIVKGEMLLKIAGTLAPILALGIVYPVIPYLDLVCVGLLGAGIAPIFPTWIGLTPKTVRPEYAGQAIGFQVSFAAIGIATIPGIVSVAATRFGLGVIPYALLCLTLLFGFWQHRAMKSSALETLNREI